jgi:ketosteroid isomerase-like protein
VSTRARASSQHGAAITSLVWLAALIPSLAGAQSSTGAASAAPLPPAVHSAAECAVWRREMSFAKSVEAHDAKAFAAHLHPGAVFNAGSRSPLRGGEAVARAWAGIVEGKEFILRWRPGVVAIGGNPDIALSRGPSFSETPGADPKERYKVGFFQSVWVRDAASGEWRVLFDRADGPPRIVATADEGRAHLAAQSSDECVASK